MRVVAGAFKGQRISVPRRGSARPTRDRVREAVFSMLGTVEGSSVLDLFAGSGALGIEALSRGAANVTFVDSEPGATAVVGANVERLGIEQARVRVFRADAMSFLRGAARHGDRWDLAFCDPPYKLAARLGGELGALLVAVLTPEARVLCESSYRQPLRLDLPLLVERRYGDTLIVIHSTEGASPPSIPPHAGASSHGRRKPNNEGASPPSIPPHAGASAYGGRTTPTTNPHGT